MLTPERAQSLWDAGINQFNISLDYLDGGTTRRAAFPGSDARRSSTHVAAMRERGIDNIRFNTVIKNDNLDQILPIVRRAAELGCGVNFSVYTDCEERQPRAPARRRALRASSTTLVAELLAFKRRRRGVITNSDYYLEQIPRYVRGEMTEPCRSGHAHDPHRSDRAREALPGFPDRFPLARLQGATSRSTATRATTRAAARRRRRCGSRACAT